MARNKQEISINFEKSLDELNVIVEELEHGGLSLEQALKNFEKGVTLVRNCQSALKDAEQKVQILLKQNGTETLALYENDNPEE